MTECVHQISLQSYLKSVDIRFDGPNISSDGGVLLLHQIDQELGLSQKIAALLPDDRDPVKLQHPRLEQVKQRLYQIVLGYEDCNDADTLRDDPLLKLVCGLSPEGDKALSSQPTLCRFEHVSTWDVIEKMLLLFEQQYVDSLPDDTTLVILDVDPTDDPVHGKQEGGFYNGYYRRYIFLPLLVFDAQRSQLVSAILRTGNSHAAQGAFLVVERILRAIKARFPHADILVRADCGFAIPLLHETLDALNTELGGIDYLLGQPTNATLTEKAKPFLEQAAAAYQQNHQKVRFFGNFEYQAETWQCPRTVVVKAEITEKGSNPRYIVTSLTDFSAQLNYGGYCERGQCENMIKDFKNALAADRLSCMDFVANFFRLLLHGFAYRLLHALRERVEQTMPWVSIQEGTSECSFEQAPADLQGEPPPSPPPSVQGVLLPENVQEQLEPKEAYAARFQFDTLRLKLLKVPVLVRESAHRILLKLPKAFPWAALFRALLLQGEKTLGMT